LSGLWPRRQSGIALLSVMVMALVVTAVLAGIAYRHQLGMQRLARSLHGEQALLLGLSAESYALKVLRDDARDSDTDHLLELWAYPVNNLPVEEALVAVRARDLQGRFNLNNLVAYDPQRWQQELADSGEGASWRRVLERLLELRGLPPDNVRVASLVDWLDTDEQPLAPGSAEDADYQLLSPPRRAANTLLTGVDELAAVQGYGLSVLYALQQPDDSWQPASLVSALPEVTAVNVNTADPVLLLSLHPRFDPRLVEDIVAARPFADLDAFYELLAERLPVENAAQLRSWLPEAMVTVASRYFQVDILVRLGAAATDLRVTVFRPDNGRPLVLSREVRNLPDWAQADAGFDTATATNPGKPP